MHLSLYLPLLFPLVATVSARPLAERLEPRVATWVLTGAALALAAASSLVLGLLTVAGLVRIPLVAALADLSLPVIRRGQPPAWWVAVIASLLLAAAVIAVARTLWRRTRAFLAAEEAACLPGPRQLVVLEDPAADAFAMPGLPGKIVVSTGMLAALDDRERQVLLAHERAHLRSHHYLFTNAAQLAAAANPLLRPLASAVAYTVERWADEHAARVTGDRRRVAVTVGKAALAARRTRATRPVSEMVLGALGRHRRPRAAGGPVPRRVAALLAPAPRHRPLPLAASAVLLAATALCAHQAYHDLHHLLRLARIS
ncbi:M56 family metallopeptidase [Kitasatospora sp. NBC_01287]|uniref:M56 family metallopeptidase n=1 Tax=Kitasatospora sp. NBC_01287 TaxID=2903573 RepID=UPI0022534BF8|nr:M56 family metallopeptidase [Kitasatospora sp. NBC_01287]MCX4749226.1 M56 family metallopeptidase [Kitasatospora sp. NBC_01287]